MDQSIIRNNENSDLGALSNRDKVRPPRMGCPSPPEGQRGGTNKQEKTNHRHRLLTANDRIIMCASIETIIMRISAEERKIRGRREFGRGLPLPVYAHGPSDSVRWWVYPPASGVFRPMVI